MGRSVQFCFGVVFFAISLSGVANALECLLCKSSDFESQCRTGEREFKPKLDECKAPHAKCYAIAQVSLNGTSHFERGCTIFPDFCSDQSDVQYCRSCGSQFCNFWIMDIGADAEGILNEGGKGVLITKRRRKTSEEEAKEETSTLPNDF